MSIKINYFRIGLFVLAAVALIIAGIIVLSAGALTRKNLIMETYLDESVQGLEVGSPIKLRGVKVGQVETIAFVDEAYDTHKRYVLIRFSIKPHLASEIEGDRLLPILNREIQTGLRLRLASQGLTGVAYMEADYQDPERYPPISIDWQPQYPYIPSTHSFMARVSDSVGTILQQLEKARLDQIASNLNFLLVTAAGLIQDDVKPSLHSLRDASAETMLTVAMLREDLQPLLETDMPSLLYNARAASSNLIETSVRINRVLRQVEGAMDGSQTKVEGILKNLQEASEEVRDLVRNARQYPSGVLFGKPPPPVEDQR